MSNFPLFLPQESFYNNMVQEAPSSGDNFIASVTADYRGLIHLHCPQHHDEGHLPDSQTMDSHVFEY